MMSLLLEAEESKTNTATLESPTQGTCAHCGQRHTKVNSQCRPANPTGAPKTGRKSRARSANKLVQQKCTECQEDNHAKGLCKFHYQRWRRGSAAICIEEGCEEPKAYRARYFCQAHSPCTHPDCRERFKARRLCDKHYQTDYLTPKNRTERERFKERQMSLLETEMPEAVLHQPEITLAAGAPPLHIQARCPKGTAEPYQRYADALTMLQAARILPKQAVTRGRQKTANLFTERVRTERVRQGQEGTD